MAASRAWGARHASQDSGLLSLADEADEAEPSLVHAGVEDAVLTLGNSMIGRTSSYASAAGLLADQQQQDQDYYDDPSMSLSLPGWATSGSTARFDVTPSPALLGARATPALRPNAASDGYDDDGYDDDGYDSNSDNNYRNGGRKGATGPQRRRIRTVSFSHVQVAGPSRRTAQSSSLTPSPSSSSSLSSSSDGGLSLGSDSELEELLVTMKMQLDAARSSSEAQRRQAGATISALEGKVRGMAADLGREATARQAAEARAEALDVELVSLQGLVNKDKGELDNVFDTLRHANLISSEKVKEQEERDRREEAKRAALDMGFRYIEQDSGMVYDEGVENLNQIQRLRVQVLRTIRWLKVNAPLLADLEMIQSRYGSGIATYYRFNYWIFANTTAVFVLYVLMSMRHFLSLSSTQWTALGNGALYWMEYSSYSSREQIIYIGYILSVMMFYVFSTIVRLVEEDRSKRQTDLDDGKPGSEATPFASLALAAWHHGVMKARLVEDARIALADHLKLLLLEENEIAEAQERTRLDRGLILSRRIVGAMLVTLLIAAGWVSILALTVSQTELTRQASLIGGGVFTSVAQFVVPVAVSVLSAVLPFLLSIITRFERWDDPSFALKLQVSRLYVMKILNVLIVAFGYYQLLSGDVLIDGTQVASIPGVCKEDQVGNGFFLLFTTSFLTDKIATLAMAVARLLVFRWWRIGKPKEEISVAARVIDLIYSQALFWLALPFLPAMAAIASLAFFLSFKYEVWVMQVWKEKPLRPWRAKDVGVYFISFYLITFSLFLLNVYYFTNVVRHDCGPNTGAIDMDVLPVYLASNQILSPIWELISNPMIVWMVVAVYITAYSILKNKLGTLQNFVIHQQLLMKREIGRLNAQLAKQKLLLEHHDRIAKAKGKKTKVL